MCCLIAVATGGEENRSAVFTRGQKGGRRESSHLVLAQALEAEEKKKKKGKGERTQTLIYPATWH